MADGIKGIATDINEAVVKPVADEVGKAIEQGAQSIIYGQKPTNPADEAKKKEEDQKNLADARRKIKFWQDLEAAQKKVREEEKQKKAATAQQEQKKKEEKQFQVAQKKQTMAAAVKEAQTRTEAKKGVGG